ncbi:MAG: hypothetical protein H7323_13125 [Frankiales bacterium]|nr:hypothetical protein [Frankiales bacterium]
MTIFAPLLLAAPLLVLATAVVALAHHGPLGWLAAVLLILGVAWISLRAGKLALRWWRSTKVAPRPQERPADRRRVPPA